MFGGDLTTYTKIMDALNKADRMEQSWSGRARLLLKDMKADPLRTDETSTRDLLPSLEELDAQAKEVEEQAVWVRIYAHKFRDPADGKEAIYMELADITRLVNKEEAVKESRQHEHAILKEIIPEHIIGFLLEEKKSKERKGSGTDSGISSPGPGRSQSDVALLSLDNIRKACESRVASMAELHHNVTILFTDIVGFTKISSQFEPAAVMVMLNNLFTTTSPSSSRTSWASRRSRPNLSLRPSWSCSTTSSPCSTRPPTSTPSTRSRRSGIRTCAPPAWTSRASGRSMRTSRQSFSR